MIELTVGELKKKLQNIDDKTLVCIQRIEDFYFIKNGWEHCLRKVKSSDNEMDEYIPATSSYFRTTINDENIFVIDAHY